MTQVIKRDGETKQEFNKEKIVLAIDKAMKYGSGIVKHDISMEIAEEIEVLSKDSTIDIYDIEAKVFDLLCEKGQVQTARAYEGYRKVREYQKQKNTVDGKVWGLIDGSNEETLKENSNKQASLISTQRDLVAEEVSKDLSLRMMLPPHIAQAHQDGLIHIHK